MMTHNDDNDGSFHLIHLLNHVDEAMFVHTPHQTTVNTHDNNRRTCQAQTLWKQAYSRLQHFILWNF